MVSRSLFMVTLCMVACGRTDANVSADAGSDAAGAISPAAIQEALRIAGDLELAHERYYACRGRSQHESLWDATNRECFISVLATHVERNDELSACIRDEVQARSQCGEATACSDVRCADAIFLDDTPIEELLNETCGGPLDPEARSELVACRRRAAP